MEVFSEGFVVTWGLYLMWLIALIFYSPTCYPLIIWYKKYDKLLVSPDSKLYWIFINKKTVPKLKFNAIFSIIYFFGNICISIFDFILFYFFQDTIIFSIVTLIYNFTMFFLLGYCVMAIYFTIIHIKQKLEK
jgi:hypothetical protein